MRTERKKHHINSTSDMPELAPIKSVESTILEIEPFEAPSPTKAEVKAQEERARKKAARSLQIKKAKERKKAEEALHQLAIKKELAKAKQRSTNA
jgi:hypothetical protein